MNQAGPPYPQNPQYPQQPPGHYGPPPPGPGPYPPGGPPFAYPPPPPRRSGGGAKTAAKGCLYTLAVLFLLAIVGGVIATSRGPEREPQTGQVTAPATLSAFDLQPGDCYDESITGRPAPPPTGSDQTSNQLVVSVAVKPCTEPHLYQVISKISYAATDSWQDVSERLGAQACEAEFREKLSQAVRSDTTLHPGTLVPADPQSWTRHPSVACVVSSDTPITRSLLS
ncbi:hypothetical protein [Pseudonocardia sp.]|uniref:hypothetical protein n=1 Tax=Pseudonocardia sp. TaxID=60912 RepID=UPI003D13FA81